MKKLLFLVFLGSTTLQSQNFTLINNSPVFDYDGNCITVGDLDTDGFPEIIVTNIFGMLRVNNTGGQFATPINYPQWPGWQSMAVRTVEMGDINRDGLIDIMLGRGMSILTNSGSGFVQTEMQLPSYGGSLYLSDFEGDGDLDVLTSSPSLLPGPNLCLNLEGGFIEGQSAPLSYTRYSNWTNLDNDPYLESVHSVIDASGIWKGNYVVKNGPGPIRILQSLAGLIRPITDIAFGDYDHDGDLDMLVKAVFIHLYRNDSGSFTLTSNSFPFANSAEFADMNNDGLYDIVMGAAGEGYKDGIYINNDNGTFTRQTDIQAIRVDCQIRVADIDADNDLDIITDAGVFRNNNTTLNQRPATPPEPSVSVSGNTATLSWLAAQDDTTPTAALTYNVEVRTATGKIIVSPHAVSSGRRQVFKMGNAFNKLFYTLTSLEPGDYEFRVQVIDAAYVGSEFSVTKTFSIGPPLTPVNLVADLPDDENVQLTWEDHSSEETAYVIFRRELSQKLYSILDTLDANTTTYNDEGWLKIAGAKYIYRVQALPMNTFASQEITAVAQTIERSQELYVDSYLDGTTLLLGDYDNDSDLDIALSIHGSDKTWIFNFNGVEFEASGIILPVSPELASWIDINSDGFIDFCTNDGTVFVNNHGTAFTSSKIAGLPTAAKWLAMSWGDYDRDGDEDVILQLAEGPALYENNGLGIFEKVVTFSVNGFLKSVNAWADFDRDGDLDLLLGRTLDCDRSILLVLENIGGSKFKELPYLHLPIISGNYGQKTGTMEWGDFDGDGYSDLLVAGMTNCVSVVRVSDPGMSRIYRNTQNKDFSHFHDVGTVMYDVNGEWGDFDNDGDLDIFLHGAHGSNSSVTVCRNNGPVKKFRQGGIASGRYKGAGAVGDYDNDGDLDYVVAQFNPGEPQGVTIYKNLYTENEIRMNTKPTAPTGLNSRVTGSTAIISWDAGSDEQTSETGLLYNVYIKSKNDFYQVGSYSSAQAARTITDRRNLSSLLEKKIWGLEPGVYEWGVQSVDASLRTSAFSEGQELQVVITSIQEEENLKSSIFPNPTSSTISIILPTDSNILQVTLTNSVGQPIRSYTISGNRFEDDISALPAGLYLLHLTDKDGDTVTHKLLKL